MILNNAPLNEAIVSNVTQTGGFRIKQSAKAFSILSSSIYANKIKAIIRELSCNALDSHIAAGKKDIPFEVHLPTTLEPWFSVRDFGIGLNHNEVMDIYTTYFESTKTDSNDYVGALGLGSKSPFSYTENFTVTAIMDGVKRIYTAYINDSGTPDIALMDTSVTNEVNGVEVRFSINDKSDFSAFSREAQEVYKYFEYHPSVSGSYTKIGRQYVKKDIIPGTHIINGYTSYIVMGNIAYPIDRKIMIDNYPYLRELINTSIEINVPIGSVEFQPSREGLSYIPLTLSTIKAKYEEINATLYSSLKSDADKITCRWKLVEFLMTFPALYNDAKTHYIKDNNLQTLMPDGKSNYTPISLSIDDLYKKYNIAISGFQLDSSGIFSRNTARKTYSKGTYIPVFGITVKSTTLFVINDRNVGAYESSKYHAKENNIKENVVILSRVDKSRPALFDEFLKSIENPPTTILASKLTAKPRVKNAATGPVSVLQLVNKSSYGSVDLRWEVVEDIAELDSKEIHCYVSMSGFEILSEITGTAYEFYDVLKSVSPKTQFFGVRKGSIEKIKKLKNWLEPKDFVTYKLANISLEDIQRSAMAKLGKFEHLRYIYKFSGTIAIPADLDIFTPHFSHVTDGWSKKTKYLDLSEFISNTDSAVKKSMDEYLAKYDAIISRYPLLQYLRNASHKEVLDYINLINKE